MRNELSPSVHPMFAPLILLLLYASLFGKSTKSVAMNVKQPSHTVPSKALKPSTTREDSKNLLMSAVIDCNQLFNMMPLFVKIFCIRKFILLLDVFGLHQLLRKTSG